MRGFGLKGLMVVSLEQAVAAPLATARLADAGARVIKIEREGTGDFARHYDKMVHGESTYFTWLNRGKESLALNVKRPESISLVHRILAKADVFVQNLGPGAAARLGLGSEELTAKFPHLITMDISGYGEQGPKSKLAAYDLLVQAESAICVTSGPPGSPARVGASVVDITTGMNAHGAIMEALYARDRNGGKGCALKTSLFGSASELMSVPFLQQYYTQGAPVNCGLAHPSIAPYRAFGCSDGKEVLLSIQNEREWKRLCDQALELPGMATDPRFCGPTERVTHRAELDACILAVTVKYTRDEMMARLQAASVACAAVNDVPDLVAHPQIRLALVPMPTDVLATVVAPPVYAATDPDTPTLGRVPALGEHTDAITKEFSE